MGGQTARSSVHLTQEQTEYAIFGSSLHDLADRPEKSR